MSMTPLKPRLPRNNRAVTCRHGDDCGARALELTKAPHHAWANAGQSSPGRRMPSIRLAGVTVLLLVSCAQAGEPDDPPLLDSGLEDARAPDLNADVTRDGFLVPAAADRDLGECEIKMVVTIESGDAGALPCDYELLEVTDLRNVEDDPADEALVWTGLGGEGELLMRLTNAQQCAEQEDDAGYYLELASTEGTLHLCPESCSGFDTLIFCTRR